VPARIRQTLNVESGLNDGIMVPVVMILLSLAAEADAGDGSYWFLFSAKQVLLGPLAGVVVGLVGGKLVERSTRAGWMSAPFQRLSVLGLALLAYSSAGLVGGNGFIAAFIAGMIVGNFSRSICGCLYEFGEAEGQLLTYFVFSIFGAVMVPRALEGMTGRGWLYAVLSLTVIRMVPVALSLVGRRLRPDTVTFLGWFGPRGLASILFALLILEEFALPGGSTITSVVVATVLLSVFAHGLTAAPAAALYARRMETVKDEPEMAEHLPVREMPLRHKTL
jgi:NhaP-type Na+/H+ or K+/H+ antiporter